MAGTFLSPSWYRVADIRPRLRSHVEIQRQRYRGHPWYVVHDPVSGKFHRFSAGSSRLLQLMDGRRTVDQIWSCLAETMGEKVPTQDEVIQMLSKLHSGDLLQGNLPPDLIEMTERGEKQKRQKWLQSLKNPMAIRLPLWDPDGFLNRNRHLLSWLFSRAGLLLWLLIVLPAGVLAAINLDELTENLGDRVLAADNLLMLLVIFPLLKFLHELGHAYAVKREGGEVHEMGVMFLVLMPVPYVDASASSAFRNKWRRMLVGGAGMLVELFLAALAMFVWVLIEPGLLRSIAYNVIFIAGVSTILFNANPLLRFDGYYVLADWLEIPNLAQRANHFWMWLGKRYLIGAGNLERPESTAAERNWFVLYAPAAFVYRVFITLTIALFVGGQFFFIGVILALWTLCTMFVIPLVKLLNYVFSHMEIQRQRARALLLVVGGLTGFAVFATLVPVPLKTQSEGVVWIPEQAELRARGAGVVEHLLTSRDTLVQSGEPLLVLRDQTLETEVLKARERVRRLQIQRTELMFEDRLQASILAEDLAREKAELARLLERVDDLLVTSGIAGQVEILGEKDLPERYVHKGTLLGYVIGDPSRTVRVVVPQDNISLVRDHLRSVEVKLADRISETYPARIVREVPGGHDLLPSKALSQLGGGPFAVDPRDVDGLKTLNRVFQFDLELPDSVGEVHLGTRVHVLFKHTAEPLWIQWERRLRQLFLSRFDV